MQYIAMQCGCQDTNYVRISRNYHELIMTILDKMSFKWVLLSLSLCVLTVLPTAVG